MNILYELLNELKYNTKESFSFDVTIYDENINVAVNSFVSVEYPCQTYLVIETRNDKLNLVNNEYLKALALAFRKTDFHESDMDKNTTLLISSLRTDYELINNSAKVIIEDDPYYFKKYVFSHTNANQQHATEYLEHRKAEIGDVFSYVEEILKYLLDAGYFGSYKDSKDDLSTYSYFIELATKIPAFPLNVQSSEQIKTVDDFMKEKLNTIKINIGILDRFVLSDINFKEDSVDAILAKYDSFLVE